MGKVDIQDATKIGENQRKFSVSDQNSLEMWP